MPNGATSQRQHCEKPERPLRRVVAGEVGKRGHPADRGHLDEVTAALGAQVRQGGLG